MKKRTKLIIDSLNDLYPNAHCELIHHNTYELLIAVVLSAQTTDVKVNKVTKELFKKYPDIYSLKDANKSELEQIIKPLGLYHNKANNLISLANKIVSEYQGEIKNDRKILESLNGVGRKTCNIILNNCFDVPAFAVDTHVSRISKRLMIACKDDDALKIEKKLMNEFPEELWGKLHHQFIFFGRYMCKAIKPECTNCPLKSICNYLE